jgi:hypothetical protein
VVPEETRDVRNLKFRRTNKFGTPMGERCYFRIFHSAQRDLERLDRCRDGGKSLLDLRNVCLDRARLSLARGGSL